MPSVTDDARGQREASEGRLREAWRESTLAKRCHLFCVFGHSPAKGAHSVTSTFCPWLQ